MKISELIMALQTILKESGDNSVFMATASGVNQLDAAHTLGLKLPCRESTTVVTLLCDAEGNAAIDATIAIQRAKRQAR